ncbi:MAG: FAD-dependent oxidoreductase [bacterium]
MRADVAIIGGGISGLAAACALQQAGMDWLLVEASDEPGGRMRTDSLDGALVDRGFQVLNTSYPALQRSVDLELLELESFQLGARIMSGGRMSSFYDPQRLPGRALTSLGSSPANLADYTALARLSLANAGNDPALLDLPAREVLPQLGFSERFIRDFLVPLFSAVFLSPTLDVPWRNLREMLLLFSQGLASLPAEGMQALPRLMLRALDPQRIHCGRPVAALQPGGITLADGGCLDCRLTILATTPDAARALTGITALPLMRGVRSFHFAADNAPTPDPILYLPGGAEEGPLCSLAIPSSVQPAYGFGQRAQVIANSLEMELPLAELRAEVQRQLGAWFGAQAGGWELVAVHDLPQSLPCPVSMGSLPGNEELVRERQLLLCGDYPGTPSINRALASGRSAGNYAAMHLKSHRS